ncbi:protein DETOXIFICATION 33 [Dendrobium catenatum]|uniref:Protein DETOXIFICATION n=1 Tax=Dendrobium catenatum TaxID=906689 RepID=A0A2I0VM92_9ASPA|nr:protein DETOXIFICATION 33 [Dendrobium catenatum]PKU64521.1 Protein TRANSPARENT TESTA 12 [Dendrobium catenatum]
MSEPLLARGGGGADGDEWRHGKRDDRDDMEEIKSVGQFMREAAAENRRMWALAVPAIFTSVAQYSLGALTQVFAGHLTTLDLDAVSVENMVIAGLAFGVMLGMGSALETLCGQAFGAKQFDMLGVYMQRSWVILLTTCLILLPIYIFATPILRFFGEDEAIAVLAGRFSLYMIPQLFSYGLNFPMQKFLQAQSKVMVMAYIAAAALVLHILLSWLLIVQLGLGLVGAAASLNISWWFVVLAQFAYIAMGSCPGAWNGFSRRAFQDLGEFTRLSIASAVMLCLEFWYLMFLVILVGQLKNAEITVAAVSICLNLHGWEIMVFIGFNAAISVRVSNELGAGRPRAAKFSILIITLISGFIGLLFFTAVMALRNVYAVPFTNNPEVVRAVAQLIIVFAFTLLLDSVQPVLSGVAVGAGWQALVAYINLGCYYVVGIPLGYLFAFPLDLGVEGMWGGSLVGIGLQTIILVVITLRTDWDKEAIEAESRINKWGGSADNTTISSKEYGSPSELVA